MKAELQKFREYLDYIERHYDNVQKAWELINKKCSNDFKFIYDDYVWNCIDSNIKAHDLSKLSKEEFTQYRQYFFPVNDESKDKDLFLSAWDNHKSKNPHHWQNWTNDDTLNSYDQLIYFIENIVDWVAMGFEFGDTAKSYYEENTGDINLPDWAVELMYKIFNCIY